MAVIHILDHNTIDQIAAGEVIERPSSIVKELVENSIDAGATSITVEIRDGGISFIRVSDNGCGIEKSEIRKAFMRHATSKIESADDLMHLCSLGFRGEALSSIAAVSRVELITKTKHDMSGIRVQMEGPDETDFEEIGAPDGTTIIVRNLFFNVPVRKKFLRQPATEGGYISDLMEHMTLSNPDISFQFIVNKQVKFSTPGNGNLKQVIYSIYGKEMSESLLEIRAENAFMKLHGYLGKPSVNRATRNYEIYFLNHRFIKSNIISRALEEGYQGYVMQHKYPTCFLFLELMPELVDVNVHPTKMDVRFSDAPAVYDFMVKSVQECLRGKELIPEITLVEEVKVPEEKEPILLPMQHAPAFVKSETLKKPFTSKDFSICFDEEDSNVIHESSPISEYGTSSEKDPSCRTDYPDRTVQIDRQEQAEKNDQTDHKNHADLQVSQMDFFEEKMIQKSNRDKVQIIGQIFDTYWLMIYEDKFFMVDQHAAHEKVKYERIMKAVRSNELTTQNIFPPVILSLSGKEMELMKQYSDAFASLGFVWESFGGNEIALRTTPVELFGNSIKDMFLEILDELSGTGITRAQSVNDRIASMACKAAVKGNMKLDAREMEALLDELMTLDNPYFCPHGRPTMIYFTKQEIEKKFKRIV